MAITIEWDNNEQTALLCEYRDKWTWEEFFAAGEKSMDMQNQVGHKVDLILDMRETTIPNGVALKFRKIANIKTPNTGILVLVTNSDMVRMLFNLFTNMYSPAAKKYQIVNSIDKARFLILEARSMREASE
jgi:hypothetical protein